MLFYHAVDGFNCVDNVNNVNKMLQNIIDIENNPQWEICCSTEAGSYVYGSIGIACSGVAIAMFDMDVISRIDSDGHRHTRYDDQRCSLEEWNISIGEAWVTDIHIEHVWMTKSMYERLERKGLISSLSKYRIEIREDRRRRSRNPV